MLIHTTFVHIVTCQITAFTFTPITPLVSVHLISVSVSAMFEFCWAVLELHVSLCAQWALSTCILQELFTQLQYMYLAVICMFLLLFVCWNYYLLFVCLNYCLYCMFVVVQLLWYTMGWQWHCCIKWCEDMLSIYKLSRKQQGVTKTSTGHSKKIQQ